MERGTFIWAHGGLRQLNRISCDMQLVLHKITPPNALQQAIKFYDLPAFLYKRPYAPYCLVYRLLKVGNTIAKTLDKLKGKVSLLYQSPKGMRICLRERHLGKKHSIASRAKINDCV